MRKSLSNLLPVLAGLLMPAVPAALAVTIDGRLDSEYASTLSTQANQTSFGDTPSGFMPFDSLDVCIGSELDEAFGFVSGSTLYLFFTGNLQSYFGEPLVLPDQLEVFVDCTPGGQNRLESNNPDAGLPALAGLVFDADFSPDYWFDFAVGWSGPQPCFAYYAELPSGGAGAGYLLGRTTGGEPGTLAGGVNPFGIRATIDQTNRAGGTAGCGAASGPGVTSGIEWAIPLAAIGNPSGPIRVCAFIDGQAGQISNQILGPLPAGSCSLGAPSSVDLASIQGEQSFALASTTPTRKASWGQLKTTYR